MRVHSSPCRIVLPLLMAFVVLGGGCSWFKRGDGLSGVSSIPLTPMLRLSTTVTNAAIPYQNACGEPASLSIATPLSSAVLQKLGRVFTGVKTEPGAGARIGSDGAVDVGLGLKQIDLAIHRQITKKYPVTVTLGLDVAFLAEDGTVLISKKIQSAGLGEVEVSEQSCEVKGLDVVTLEAINLVAEGIAKQVAESVRVREYAAQRQAASPAAQRGSPPPSAGLPEGTRPIVAEPPPPADAQEKGSRPPNSPVEPVAEQIAALTFRAIIRDENRDQILQPEESLTIEVEVKNEGTVEARDVAVSMSGSPELTAAFSPVLPIGTLQPGEVKRAASTKQVTNVNEPLQGELVLSLRSMTPIDASPPAKKFTILLKPDKAVSGQPAADVDQVPKPAAALKQPKALVIAIGVGQFRDEQVPPVKYAGRDAQVMAKYLRAIASLPEDRVRLLVDGRALKQDLVETFDDWLPKRADAATVVYVFFSGRALVDSATGAVSLVPSDGTTSGTSRLYSIRRLQEALSRASIRRAILIFDVSLEPAPGGDPTNSALPNWDSGSTERNEEVMWMISHQGLQEAHAYEAGRHGLFTYHLLHGLQGAADIDRDGTVAAGELCLYARGQVSRIAREQYGNEQDPLCLPPPGQGAMVRIHPMAKGNNPKPVSPPKKDQTNESPTQSPKRTDVGPGQ
jgi:hypothetical protein